MAKAQTKSILSVLGNGGNKTPREKSFTNNSFSGGFTTPSHIKNSNVSSSQDPTGEHNWLFM